MKRAYVSVSFGELASLQPVLEAIKDALLEAGIMPFVFVEHYRFAPEAAHQMMTQALADIDRSDLLVAETSDKAIGIGVEAGYAKARHKPVVYLRHESAAHSTTVAGVSDAQLIYKDAADLRLHLPPLIRQLLG